MLLFCLKTTVMQDRGIFKSILFGLLFMIMLILASCGPVVITSRASSPPPPWFYPNRLEVVRYVYFPEYRFYYDLSARTYIYLDGGTWVRRNVLPPQYRGVDLRRSRYERVRNFNDDAIGTYHKEHNANRGRSNRDRTGSNRNTTRKDN